MESHAESEFNDCGWVQVSHDNHEVTTIMWWTKDSVLVSDPFGLPPYEWPKSVTILCFAEYWIENLEDTNEQPASWLDFL